MFLVALALFLVLIGAKNSYGADLSHIGTNQKVLVICVKWNDSNTTRMATASEWANLLNNETNTFYNKATFNQTNFKFEAPSGAPADGWFNLGYSSTSYDFSKTGQDAINLVDPYVDFSQYHRILVITNNSDFGGQGTVGPEWWRTDEGIEAHFEEGGSSVGKRLMSLAIINEWQAHSYGNAFDEAASVAAHELGHSLKVPTHYGDLRWHPGLSRDVITPWDIMGLSPTLNHFIGWAKAERQWIPAGPRTQTVGPPVGTDIDTTITLEPLETNTAGVQVIRIPFTTGAPFSGYIVENRKRINGDENLPSEGVLLSLVDENPSVILKCIVQDDPGSPGDLQQAPLEVGDSFPDPARNLTVTVLSQSGNNYRVRIQYLLPPAAKPDPMIIPWGAPPWETADIWIDSEKNGWGVYRYTDAGANPAGNGDDAWVNRDNRVYVRIRNIGPGTATNVRVQVFLNDPPGMGDTGADWAYLGTIVFPSIPSGDMKQDYVKWKPAVGAHSCIKAVIENIPGELSTTNNLAQENVTHFDTSPGSPYQPVELKIRVNNPFEKEKTPVRFHVRDIPAGWGVRISPAEMLLPPGGHDWVSCNVFPSGLPGAPLSGKEAEQLKQYGPGFIGKPKIEALVPYADTFIPIGGVDLWTHLVNPTKLVLNCKPESVSQGVAFSGRLEPAIADAPVAVEFTLGERREVCSTKTDSAGIYTVAFAPPASGLWKAQAFYGGNQMQAPANSEVCEFSFESVCPTGCTCLSKEEGYKKGLDFCRDEKGNPIQCGVINAAQGEYKYCFKSEGECHYDYEKGVCVGPCSKGQVCQLNTIYRDPKTGKVTYAECHCKTLPKEEAFRIGQRSYTVDDQAKEMDVAPFIRDNRTYTPVRYLAYMLGISDQEIAWDPTAQQVTLTRGAISVELFIGRQVIIINGEERSIDVAPLIEQGRTFLPARHVAEAFGAEVGWDPSGGTISIKLQ